MKTYIASLLRHALTSLDGLGGFLLAHNLVDQVDVAGVNAAGVSIGAALGTVLAAVIEYQGKVLLAQNAAWPGKMFALITGFMEAGETPQGGMSREIKEETSLDTIELNLIGVYDFQRMNQVIIAYHAVCEGEVSLSSELVDYRLMELADVKCWPAGTGYALADWLRSRGHEPQFVEFPKRR